MSACANAIRMDIKKEAMDTAFDDLKTQISSLEQQNADIQFKLDEEVCLLLSGL